VGGLEPGALDTVMSRGTYNALLVGAAGLCFARVALIATDRGPWALLAAGLLV